MTEAVIAEAERLAACYRAIFRQRMDGLPICNPGLQVQCVGLRPFQGEAIGVLITPWCMNLVLLQLPTAPPRPALPAGKVRDVALPAGTIAFTVAAVEGFGRVEAASLFSPMHDFPDQATAEATALAALQAALTPPTSAAPGRRSLLLGRGSAA